MEEYYRYKGSRRSLRSQFPMRSALILVLFSAWLAGAWVAPGSAAETPAVAVFPFEVNAADYTEQLGLQVQKMLAEVFSRKGIEVADPGRVNMQPVAGKPGASRLQLLEAAAAVDAGIAITGSVTQIGREVSIDLELIDSGRPQEPKLFFRTAERMDLLQETIEAIANSVYLELSGVPQVDSVRVEGNRRIEDAAILMAVDTEAGDLVDQGRLDKDLRAVYQMGYFDDVQIRLEDGPKGKVVIFEVTEKPSVGDIVFSGNKKIKDDDLQKELGFSRYSVYDPNEVRQSVQRLKELYRQKAYYNAEIMVDVSDLPNNEVKLDYRIRENQKVFITDISFKGNDSFSEGRLKKIMMTSEKGFFSWITSSGHLDKRKLEVDLLKLSSFYHNHGFIKAKIGEPEIVFDKEKGISLLFEIHEGPRYEVGSLALEGDLDRPEEELLEKVELAAGDVFNREVLREDVQRIRDVFVDEGYAYADVNPLTEEDEKNHTVDITFRISKGKKVKFERILVSGNTVTRENVIRRELAAVEGDYFSGEAFRKSSQNLRRLDYFEDVEVQTRKGSSDEEIILDIKVEERPTGVFAAGAGYSSEENGFVMFELGERNLLGKGYSAFANARIGGISTYYDIKFMNPWVYDTPISMGIDIYNWKREWDDYTRDSWGGAFKLGFPLAIDEYTRGSVKYGYDDAHIYDVRESAAWQIREMIGKNVTSSATFELRRDSTDRAWNTTKGSINSLTFEYAGGALGGDEYFNRYEARSAWFFPVKWGTAVMLQGRLGYLKKRSGGSLSVFQKYKLGGINSVRGFEYGTISPMEGDNYIGGEKMMVYNIEYRFPLVEEQGVTGVVFFDAGNVFLKDESYTFSGIRKSAGAGIRWYSPIGPLRLEYGRNLDPTDRESNGGWEFTVGGTF